MEVIRNKPFPPYNPIGEEEAQAAYRTVADGMLSDYIARAGDKFLGGKKVRELEAHWAEYHQVKFAISFNTATSALVAAIGAVGILPGEEVVVMPYSMCISATAPLFYDAIPVFADIEDDCFCIDPTSLEQKISPRTRAILSVDLFGQSADMTRINEIARRHNLKVICDTSHAPGCAYNGGFAGTFGDIGIFSLNQHKIIHCGEGGIAVTNDDDLALRLQLIRNHAEAVVGEIGYPRLTNMLGGNYRLPEVEAAIATEQLKKLPDLLARRIELADYLTEQLSRLDYLIPPVKRPGSAHVYYLYPIKFREEAAGVSRQRFVANVNAMGIPLHRFAVGYIKPLYLEPIFAQREQFKQGFPYSLLPSAQQPDYRHGICPVAERMHERELIVTAYNYPPLTKHDMDDILKAFSKGVRQS